MRSLIDLHCHSTVSDGVLTPSEVVNLAVEKGIRVLALTDHDDVDGLATARALAEKQGMKFIDGVEISVTWRRRTLHIVGLKIDPKYPPLVNGLANIRAGRHTRAVGMAEALEKMAFMVPLRVLMNIAKGVLLAVHILPVI